MVKSITTIICGFLVLLSVSSCRKEQEEPCPENGRVTFTVAQTRATQEGTFEKGNSIGVFAIEPKTGVYWATNNKYTYDGRSSSRTGRTPPKRNFHKTIIITKPNQQEK